LYLSSLYLPSSWQPFRSQLSPNPGSHGSPGHHSGNGPGWAPTMLATPTPANAKPAMVIAVAAAKHLMFFTLTSYHAASSRHPRGGLLVAAASEHNRLFAVEGVVGVGASLSG
jgi:hypothetical protein